MTRDRHRGAQHVAGVERGRGFRWRRERQAQPRVGGRQHSRARAGSHSDEVAIRKATQSLGVGRLTKKRTVRRRLSSSFLERRLDLPGIGPFSAVRRPTAHPTRGATSRSASRSPSLRSSGSPPGFNNLSSQPSRKLHGSGSLPPKHTTRGLDKWAHPGDQDRLAE